eukprot:TRINITY_DN22090_c0_g1_i1.p1 TRINITY_DN22090_c0_g1~~TRINITY_DN22090_c0_g1_i1.p1  ORF type:complete len:238 (-),score=39.14 TRINITY_DN22090_c0_g1_i1:223-936(-)
MSLDDIICLDVGGTRFDTTRQTLVKDPNSMLAKMFDPMSPMRPGQVRNGAIFLDRDPEWFRAVLNYLRNGILLAETQKELMAILTESRYFGLTGLEQEVTARLEEESNPAPSPNSSQSPTSPGPNEIIKLNVGGKIFQTTKTTLCKYPSSRIAQLVQGLFKQTLDSEGNIFIDEDPRDFEYILRALRNTNTYPTTVPKETIDNVINLRDNLEIREIKFGYREKSDSYVSEYFLSVCR